ncbi:hypothetical protein LO771_27640 [Streptacidiphilus sp. ASG 303]|uniref:hypothetical protein n=1 Tax=Streptacidiphilus sp. ASG 303 TaxID=2896847 RepID=UPI001E57C41A|nr:hypothetical protein [Streptacidiphilus sp. ASG 303]MCD0486057.1 hypothetical protein [Streptacidiphilus sp. ASG 303]
MPPTPGSPLRSSPSAASPGCPPATVIDLASRRLASSEREARLELFRWLHRYDTVRRRSCLGQRSPIAYETALQATSTTLTQAA